MKLTFYKLDGKLDFLNLILPKTIPNKGLRLKFERSTSNSCYENQALDTESNLNLTIYRLDGDLDLLTDPERQTKMKTNDGRGKKKRVLLDTEKFITRKVN